MARKVEQGRAHLLLWLQEGKTISCEVSPDRSCRMLGQISQAPWRCSRFCWRPSDIHFDLIHGVTICKLSWREIEGISLKPSEKHIAVFYCCGKIIFALFSPNARPQTSQNLEEPRCAQNRRWAVTLAGSSPVTKSGAVTWWVVSLLQVGSFSLKPSGTPE